MPLPPPPSDPCPPWLRKKLARGAGCEDVRTRTTIRNLRIREDTAKYLLNLDLNSAHYDPKTRSMRGNPHGEV